MTLQRVLNTAASIMQPGDHVTDLCYVGITPAASHCQDQLYEFFRGKQAKCVLEPGSNERLSCCRGTAHVNSKCWYMTDDNDKLRNCHPVCNNGMNIYCKSVREIAFKMGCKVSDG